MKIIKQQSSLSQSRTIMGLSFLILFVLAFSSCKKEEKLTQPPLITGLEIGHHGEVTAGSDLHLEAEIVAEAGIREIEIHIHGEDGIDYSISKKYIDGKYIGVKNASFHEHIDIPQDAPKGSYHLHFSVTDQEGRETEVDGELNIL